MQANKRQLLNLPGDLYVIPQYELNEGKQGKHRSVYGRDTVQLGLVKALPLFNVARPHRQHWYLLQSRLLLHNDRTRLAPLLSDPSQPSQELY